MSRLVVAIPTLTLVLAAALTLVVACEGDGASGGGAADTSHASDVSLAGDGTPLADTGTSDTAAPLGDAVGDAVGDAAAPEDVPSPPADVPAPPEDVPGPPEDAPAPPADVPAPPADVPADVPPAEDVPLPPAETLTVACTVRYVLDESQATDMVYMALHFGDLVQQWGIEGTVRGVDLTAFPEKMYYGAHPPDGDLLSLIQVSMLAGLVPAYSVRVDFFPDTAVVTGSEWGVGVDEGDAQAVVVRHDGTSSLCLFAMGIEGALTVISASGVDATEGGAFRVTGSMQMADPAGVEGACELFAASGIPCCE